jgi:hypothetical protein
MKHKQAARRLVQNEKFIRKLPHVYKNAVDKKKLFQDISPRRFNCLCEIIKNLLFDNIKLDENTKKRFHAYTQLMKDLASRHISIKQKKKELFQTGSGGAAFLIPLFTTVFPAVIEFIKSLRSKP